VGRSGWGPRAQVEIGKEYQIAYEGKMKREQVLASTAAAPWQLVRDFCTETPHDDPSWKNLLVWGDNLLALRGLLDDQQGENLLGTRDKIKLVYIDPPFATRQDFMKDKEKAYRDKIHGAQFIEFLRRRIILLHEVMADDASIYVHLDTKKGHYLKGILDEVFGEENFQNEIIWKRTPFAGSSKARAAKFPVNHDSLFFYTKSSEYFFKKQHQPYTPDYVRRFTNPDDDPRGPWQSVSLKTYSEATFERLKADSRLIAPQRKGAGWRYKWFLDDTEGKLVEDIWTDINIDNPMSEKRAEMSYPTMKPEELLERIITASSRPDDIVLDCFAGSGTTPATAEKLGRRWIAMDSGKLAIYTMQKRLLSLTDSVGARKIDARTEIERAESFGQHLKKARAALMITDKARGASCEVSVDLLSDLAAVLSKHGMVGRAGEFAVACAESKVTISEQMLSESQAIPGDRSVKVGGVEFVLCPIGPRVRYAKPKPLPARHFALHHAGVYDMDVVYKLPWSDYQPFVLKLFGVRKHAHGRYGFRLDGYIGTNSAFAWDYPDQPGLTIDHGYVADLHKTLRGKPGERFYVIAPVAAMDFLEDEVIVQQTTYVFLKVPMSVLLRLIEQREAAAFKQPRTEDEVKYNLTSAAGFDFISQPKVSWRAYRDVEAGQLLPDYVLEIEEFRSRTLATDPEDHENFEKLSMVMADCAYEGELFRLTHVFWGKQLIDEAGGIELAQSLRLGIPEEDFVGEKMMIVFCDLYGNEKTLLLSKADFGEGSL